MYEKNYKLIIKEISEALSKVDHEKFTSFINKILSAENIFLAGAGRMGIMLSAFCMRLYHLGYNSNMVGSITTPPISKNDLLIVGSSSGETRTILQIAKIASEFKPEIFAITANPRSSIVKLCTDYINIPGPYSLAGSDLNARYSQQPMKSLFEQCLLVLLDSAVLQILETAQINANGMAKRHTNLE